MRLGAHSGGMRAAICLLPLCEALACVTCSATLAAAPSPHLPWRAHVKRARTPAATQFQRTPGGIEEPNAVHTSVSRQQAPMTLVCHNWPAELLRRTITPLIGKVSAGCADRLLSWTGESASMPVLPLVAWFGSPLTGGEYAVYIFISSKLRKWLAAPYLPSAWRT